MRRSNKAKSKKKSRPARSWQLQIAKARFSELVRRARTIGPQVVTKQGREEVVILDIDEFKRLTQRARQPDSLVRFFAESPLAEAGIDLERNPDYGRTVDL